MHSVSRKRKTMPLFFTLEIHHGNLKCFLDPHSFLQQETTSRLETEAISPTSLSTSRGQSSEEVVALQQAHRCESYSCGPAATSVASPLSPPRSLRQPGKPLRWQTSRVCVPLRGQREMIRARLEVNAGVLTLTADRDTLCRANKPTHSRGHTVTPVVFFPSLETPKASTDVALSVEWELNWRCSGRSIKMT